MGLLLKASGLAAELNLDQAYVEATYPLGFGGEGATWDGQHLWIVDSLSSPTKLIKKYDVSGNEPVLVHSIPFSEDRLIGLAWDGQFLWSSRGDKYFRIDPSDGTVVETITAAGTASLGGLTFDGQHLWKASRPEFNEIDPATGNVVATYSGIDLPGREEGLTFDGRDIFAISFVTPNDGTIWRIDPITWTLAPDHFVLPAGLYNGLAFDGTSLWVVDWSGERLLKVSFEPRVISPTTVDVVLGTNTLGNLNDVGQSDDQYFCFVRGFPFLVTGPSIWLDFEGSLPTLDPSSLELTVESQASSNDIIQRISAFNYDSSTWELLDLRATGYNVDTVANIDTTGDISRFVDPMTGNVRMRLTYSQGPAAIFLIWAVCLDQVVWKVTE